ncbi:MAG: efflux RND transporter permease subunit [Acidimicrobiia bacterium]
MKTLVRWLAAIVRTSPAVAIIVVLATTAVFAVFAPQLSHTTGIEVFVPDNAELHALTTIEEHFGSSGATVQVLITSATGDVITAEGLQAVLGVEQAIRGMDPAVALMDRPDGPIVSYLSPTLQAIQVMGYPISSLNDQSVKTAFSASLAQVPEDQRRLFEGLLSSSSTDLRSATTGTGLMVVFLDTSGLDLDAVQALQTSISNVVSGAGVGSTTATAFSAELLLTVDPLSDELLRLFIIAGATIAAILATVYWIRPRERRNRGAAFRRTFADLGLTLVAIGMSIIWVLGIGVLLGPKYLSVIGDFSPLLQVLPVLLIGLGVDFAIHLTARYREEIGAGWDVESGAQRATAAVGVALVLATATTAVGFLTNVANPIPPLKDFGILAAIGIVGAFVITLTFVPAARVLLDRRAERTKRLPRREFEQPEHRLAPMIMSKTALIAEHFAIPTLALALVLTGLGAFGMSQLTTTFSSTDFVPVDDPLRASYDTLAEEFAGGFGETVDILIQGDIATPAFHNALLAATSNLADTPHVVTVNGSAAARSPVSVIASLVEADDTGRPVNPEFAEVAMSEGLTSLLTMRVDADVDAVYRAALRAAPSPMSSVLAEASDGSLGYIRVEVSTQAGEEFAAQLAEDLADDFEPVTALPQLSATATSVNIMTASVVGALQDSQNTSLIITLAAAMVLLTVTFWYEWRRPFLGIITILPVAMVVLWTFGMMAVFDIPFGPVTAMTAALAIGIGVPYSIHVTQRYLEDRMRFDDPEAALRSTTGHTGGALAGSAFTTLAGFGVLMTSSLIPFQQFGAVTAMAIGFSLLASIGVLPSMLILWDRWHRKRGEAPAERALVGSRK